MKDSLSNLGAKERRFRNFKKLGLLEEVAQIFPLFIHWEETSLQ